MSDGNFNRALLPKNELSAGIRAGKAQMRAKAEQAFMETIIHFLRNILVILLDMVNYFNLKKIIYSLHAKVDKKSIFFRLYLFIF